MKKLFIILFTASTGFANAQSALLHPFSATKENKHDKFHTHVMMMLKSQQPLTSQKTTAMKERVIAEADRDSDKMVTDSVTIKYTGTRGSQFDYNFLSYNYRYSSFGFTPNYYPYDFSRTDVQFDSVYYWSNDGNSWDLSGVSQALYNATGLLNKIEEIEYNAGSFDYGSVYANSFDAQGRHTQLVYSEDNGSGYDSVGKLIRTYDNNNRVVEDSIFDYSANAWDMEGLFRYTYGTNGLLDSFYQLSTDGMGGWITDGLYVHTHDNAGRLQTVTGYYDQGGTLMTVVTDTFQYTGNNTYFTSLVEYQYNGSGLEPVLLLTKNINADNLPDTVWYSQYDFSTSTWVPVMKSSVQYNSNNNPQHQELATDAMGTGLFDVAAFYDYYYELYDDGTQSIRHTVENAGITLYPNPVASDLNMVWNDADGKRTTIELINTAGQKLYVRSFNWKEKNQTLSLMNAVQGMYWVVIRNAAGAVIFRQSVVKQ